MDKDKRQEAADYYTSLYDDKINDPNLRPLRMGYKTQKNKTQGDFLAGYDVGYATALEECNAQAAHDCQRPDCPGDSTCVNSEKSS